MKQSSAQQISASEKLCIDCARPIPLNAKRCTQDNCGTYQDWRRYLGSQPNLVSMMTLLGVVVAIIFNIFQMVSLAQKADKQDIAQMQQSVEKRLPTVIAEVNSLQAELLSVPDEYTNRYKRFLELPNTGIFKILPRGKYEQAMLMNGGGAYYSFARETNDYGHGDDIELGQDTFSVGFAGADYGFFLQLGDVPIQDIPVDSRPPAWLDALHQDAWSYMWTYSPPPELAKLRMEARAFDEGLKIEGATLKDEVPAKEQTTYLLRSLNIRDSDILVAFRTEARLNDGSFIVVWKMLQQFDAPVATGPDLQQ